MNTDKATPELYAALAAVQGEVENATKGSSNPHFKSKYADLAEILNTVRPVCAKHGIAILQSTAFDAETTTVSVATVLAHQGGGSISSIAACVPSKSDAQGVGAATTYLRRYALAAMTGIAQEDDDGNAAAHTKKEAPAAASVIQGIRDELDEVGADVAAFEKFLGCKLDDITIPMLPRIRSAIEKKRASKPAKSVMDKLAEMVEGGQA
jgi:hypothetical protein